MLASPKASSPLNQEQLQQIPDNLFFGFSMFISDAILMERRRSYDLLHRW